MIHGEPLDSEIALWREKMHVALLRYEAARLETRKIDNSRRQRLLPSPDGAVAYNEALKCETAALAEYRRCLTRFAEIVLGRSEKSSADA